MPPVGAGRFATSCSTESWTEIAVPAYPPQPEDNKDEFAWKLKLIETENPLWRDLSDDFFEDWTQPIDAHPNPSSSGEA